MDSNGGNQTRLTDNLPVQNIQPDWLPIISTGIDDQQVDSFVPKSFELFQNYPNPFNPNTKIKYSIKSQSFVLLKVFDVLGKEVATLINEEKLVGSYEVEFNATVLPSGIYFYQMKAGYFIQTNKMLFIK